MPRDGIALVSISSSAGSEARMLWDLEGWLWVEGSEVCIRCSGRNSGSSCASLFDEVSPFIYDSHSLSELFIPSAKASTANPSLLGMLASVT